MVEVGAVPVAGHVVERGVALVAEHAAGHAAGLAAGLAAGGPGAEHVGGLAAEFAVGVVVAAGAVPGAERDDVLVAAGLAAGLADELAVELAVELAAEQLAELVLVGAVYCSSFLVG